MSETVTIHDYVINNAFLIGLILFASVELTWWMHPTSWVYTLASLLNISSIPPKLNCQHWARFEKIVKYVWTSKIFRYLLLW